MSAPLTRRRDSLGTSAPSFFFPSGGTPFLPSSILAWGV
ncbi:unnamed protein product [Tenebrio molitor]|nr:unnamed protein product [Tenebrio molitor]